MSDQPDPASTVGRPPFQSMDLLILDQAIASGRIDRWPRERIAGLLRHLPRNQLVRFSQQLQRGRPVCAALIEARSRRAHTTGPSHRDTGAPDARR